MKKNTLFTKTFLTLGLLLITYLGFGQSPKTYSSSGTFTVPAGVTSVTAQVWGGGGKGGTRTSNGRSGGGGGGAYASSAVTVNALNAPYTVTVGTGATTTAAGSDSWFSTTGTVLAKGGQSVANNTTTGASGGLASGSIGTTKWNGGTGVDGASTYGGGGGSSAGTALAGLTGVTFTGGIAPAGGGNGGNGRSATDGNGNGGSIPGGGGGGGYRTSSGTRTGGNGADGQVILTWSNFTYSLTSTAIASPLCTGNGASVTLTGGAGLPIGNYTVTYNLTGTNTATGATASMSVTTAGTGTFTTGTLSNTGLTNIQITNLSSGVSPDNCSNAIGANNTASVTLTAVPSQPSGIIGDTVPCVGASKTYSVTNVAGVTYNWSFPAGWTQTGGGTTNSVTVTVGASSGNVSVTPSNSCGSGTARTLAVTSYSTPTQPSSITGSTTPCASTSQTYSVTNVVGTTYTWSFPAGWSQTAGGTTNSVTVTTNGTSGTISVTPSNACGTGTAQTLAVTTTTVPAQPTVITGNTILCSGTSQTYSVTDVPGVTYTWSFPSGWSQTAGGTTSSITVTASSNSGTITVTPSTSCGNGTVRTLGVTVNAVPTITGTTPGSRTGAGTVNLSATASAGTISWFANSTGGSALGTGTNFTTPGIITTTTYYVETNNGTCSSNPRVAVIATVNYPEITVLGNSNIIMDEDTSPITTDNTNLGTTGIGVGVTKNYTIQNSGTINLTVGTITIGGLNASEFVVTTAPAASVVAGGSTTFSITFTPTALGNRTANVSFVTNDPDENPFNFDIAGTGGTGLIPEINVRGNGTTIIDGDSGPTTADHTDFGSVTIPGSVTRTFTIQNTGTGPLTLTGTPYVVITGSTDFTVTTQPSSNTIAAGGSLTFQVTFNPLLTGSSVAIVSINNDDSDENVYDFAITGAAVVSGREIDVQGNEVSIVDGDTTPSTTDQTDFGITNTTTPIALTYNVYSFGSNSLTLTSTISITGTNASMFTATTLPTSLAVGGVTSFVITFTPTASLGVKTATVTITSNDPDEGTYNFDIKAEVQTPAALTVAPGGITSNLKFWLKADSNIGSTADNTSITSWQEQTVGNTKNAVSKFSKEPKFQNNPTYNVNFNPVIHFNGSNTMSGGQGFNNSDMFIVIKPTSTVNYTASPMDVYCGDDTATNKNSQDVTGFEIGNTSSRHTNELIAYNQGANTAFGIGEISTTKFYSGVNIFNPRKHSTYPTTKMEILNNGNTLTTASVLTGTYKDIVNTRYWLGRSEFFDASYDGDILEIINYDTRNSDADRNKIETYLAIKYGITLGVNGTSQNYVNSAGTTIYGAGAGFNYNIAGIGRDDNSQLNQKQSKTENTNADITIGLGDIFDTNSNNTNAFDVDRKFLVWGHNNNTLAAQAPITVDMSSGISPTGSLTSLVEFISIARTWRVVETGGDVSSVKISIPSTILTATITPPGDFLMFISDSPVFNPTAEYRIMRMNGSNLETDYDFNGTKYITFGYAPEKTFVRSIAFDGVNDYLDAGKVLNLNTSFTVSSWIKRNSTNQTILSKRNNTFTTGYDLSINSAGKAEMSWMNGTKQTITSSVVIPSGIWHNIAVSYDGTTAKLYIDGVLDVSKTMSNVLTNTQSFLIAAADGTTPTSFFNGNIDEVRVWDVALTDKQLRYVMNQEISRDATLTGGTTIPNSITLNDIKSIPWVNLSAYYPMSTYTFTNAKDISSNNYTAALKNLTTVDTQTAPLPYETANDGNWTTPATWLNYQVQDIPNSASPIEGTIDWNIVKTSHNVSSTGNKTVLGLMVNSNTITASNDTKIEITNYLKLDGKIDLQGMSQLVQTLDCDLDVTSSGSIERDQQGQSNKFNYNYWSSPVSPINTSANNTNYTVNGVFKDGTTSTPQNITWVSTYNGSATSPITLSRYWLYKFDDLINDYANWTQITETSSLKVGLGFTLKGSGAGTSNQNYTFVGKPNNGLINTNVVGIDRLLLTGNPYPSALDATEFINDNLVSTDGTLYFWEHSSTNSTHILQDYQGGYAVRNLIAGVAPVAPAEISGIGSSSKIPGQYISVGQGFLVNGSTTGGTITFKNSQRSFHKENETPDGFGNGGSNTLFRTSANHKTKNTVTNNNNNDPIAKDTIMKLRLGYNFLNKYHRQVVLGFIDGKATSGMDLGYDALNIDESPNDMYLLNGNNQLVIEGEGAFNENASYPIGVRLETSGKVSFSLDAIENFDANQAVFVYDKETNVYHSIKNELYELELPAGTYNTRFALRFKDNSVSEKTLSLDENNTNDNTIKIAHIQNSNTLKITNNSIENLVEKVILYSINGQSIANWKIENQDQQNIQIPINSISSGVYVAKLKTTTGELSKKIIIN